MKKIINNLLNLKVSKKVVTIIEILLLLIFIVVIVSLFIKPKNNPKFYDNLIEKGFKDLKEEFICKDIKKGNLIMTTRKYSIISIKGDVYNISFSSKYSNGENCEKRDFETKLVSHLDNYVLGENGKYYSIYEDLKQRDDVKYPFDTKDIIQKVDNFILKKDGNIYKEPSNDTKKEEIKYSKKKFDGKVQSISVINSSYSETDERKIVVVTDKAVYYSYSKDEEKCRKYADIECNYQMKKDEFLSKNRKSILYLDDTNLITTDGKVLYIPNNYFDKIGA